MGFEESAGAKCFTAGWAMAAKVCDSCKTSPALLFCRVDSAFLCIACDSKVHGLGNTSHDRVWMCEVCEQAPASVTCKADAAALCVTCDRDIHSANPLSRRHDRVPVVPFYDTAESVVKSAGIASFLVPGIDEPAAAVSIDTSHACSAGLVEQIPTPSWLLPNPIAKLAVDAPAMKSVDFFFSEPDPFLDFEYPISIHTSGADSVVPDHNSQPISHPPVTQQFMKQSLSNYVEIDFANPKLNSFHNNSYPSQQSLSQSMSSSDAGIVPDGSSMSDMSYSFTRNNNNNTAVELAGPAYPTAATASDRQARVLRYREKRKNRKFEKTIRYASRKAYAETRPRIKGRFAKRTDTAEADVSFNRMFMSGGGFMAEAAPYGVVPSFC